MKTLLKEIRHNPLLWLLSYVMGPTPMDLQVWPGAVVMMVIATLTASLVTNSGRLAWFVGVLVLMVYLIVFELLNQVIEFEDEHLCAARQSTCL